MRYDKKMMRVIEGERAIYGFLYGNNKIVLIKCGAGGVVQGRDNKYLKMAHRIHEKIGATGICSSNTDIDEYLDGKSLDEMAIRWVAQKKGFVDYEVYLIGNSDGGWKNLSLAKRVKQLVKFVGINTSYVDTEMLIEQLKDLSKIDKVLVCGTNDQESTAYIEPLRKAKIPNLEIKLIEGADHEFTGMTDTFIDLVNLI